MRYLKFNKVYIPEDALARHEDFDTWYEDGELFLRFQSKQGWSSEKDRVQIMGRLGGQVGQIKPDYRALTYQIAYERFDYTLHTYVIGHHYYIEGMVWDLYGSFANPPFHLVEETLTSYNHRSVHVKHVKFKNKGMCYEVHVPKLEKLRIAVASIVAIGIKEEWKGLSEGEDREVSSSRLEKLKNRIFENKGFTYEQIQEMIENGDPRVQIIKPQGRPIDNPNSRFSTKR